jgi:hypothetical protein
VINLAKDYSKFEMVKMILDFDSSTVIPPEVANYLIVRQGPEGLRCVWNHDPSFGISEEEILSLIRSHCLSLNRKSEDVHHADIVDLLGKHRGQWSFTREVRHAIDQRFSAQRNPDVRKLYYSLLDSDEAETCGKTAREVAP